MSSCRQVIVAAAFLNTVISLAAACGLDQASLDPTWTFPVDRGWIKAQSQPMPYKLGSLPVGTELVDVTYRKTGMLVRKPDNSGWWEFPGIGKLYYKGRPFALIGTAGMVSLEHGHRRYAGCITPIVIYDEDGDGRFETVTDLPGNGGPPFHVPSWFLSKAKN